MRATTITITAILMATLPGCGPSKGKSFGPEIRRDDREQVERELICQDMARAARRLVTASAETAVGHDAEIASEIVDLSMRMRFSDAIRVMAKRDKKRALRGEPMPLAKLLDFAPRNGFGYLHDQFTPAEARKIARAFDEVTLSIEERRRRNVLMWVSDKSPEG